MTGKKTHTPGEIATTSGQYEILRFSGEGTGAYRYVDAGHPFPPTPNPHERYTLVNRVFTSFTTSGSGSAIMTGTSTFDTALKNLAKK